jgi:lipopolysaccharide/colanic/teichoic acid biosynthesis glycosyltransferase
MQRLFDIIFAGIGLLVLSVMLLIISVVLRLTGEGEVIYRQVRVGRGGQHFKLLKFATMLRNSPNMGPGDITVKGDPRVLPIGRLLRKSKINELPQLWNVLVGDISLVGPRPMIPRLFAEYPAEAQRDLVTVRPGLTGIGSIVFRDEERFLSGIDEPRRFYREHIIPYKSNLEQWYIQQRSITMYFQIIMVTALALFRPQMRLAWRVWPKLPKLPEVLSNED